MIIKEGNELVKEFGGVKMARIPYSDLLIISNLRKDGRITLTKLSKRTGIPISTIFDKIKSKKLGIIKGFSAMLDFVEMGFSTLAFILIKVNKEDREQLSRFLERNLFVNSLFKVNNGYDFLFEGVFKNLKELEDFYEDIEDKFRVKSKQIFYVINELKREGFLSRPELLDLIIPPEEERNISKSKVAVEASNPAEGAELKKMVVDY